MWAAEIKNSLLEAETFLETIGNTSGTQIIEDPITGRYLIAYGGSLEIPAP